jgi:hypothetical protein
MSRHPQPSVAQIIVHKEDVARLEGDLVRVRHLGVGEDGHHPLLVVDRLGGRYRVRQPLVLQQVGYVRVVAWETQQRRVHSITSKRIRIKLFPLMQLQGSVFLSENLPPPPLHPQEIYIFPKKQQKYVNYSFLKT